ncbi:MAG: S8 family serine peptidase [Campylobacterales bacterium]|nr:S8 family serine peptidase [Campylobacterales bacterium]
MLKHTVYIAAAIAFLTSSLFAESYYNNGVLVEMTPSKLRADKHGEAVYITPNGATIAIGSTVIAALKPDSEAAKNPAAFFYGHGLDIVGTVGSLPLTFKLQPAEGESVFAVARKLFESGEVRYAEPSMTPDRKAFSLSVNDPLGKYAWHLENTESMEVFNWLTAEVVPLNNTFGVDIDVERAWELSTGEGQIIAIFDDGLKTQHEDLVGKNTYGRNLFTGTSIVDPSAEAYAAGAGHGTPVAGIAAAYGNNGKGSVGVAYDTKLSTYKMLHPDSSESLYPNVAEDVLIPAFEHAAQSANVINCSWGGGYVSQVMRDAILRLSKNGRGGKGTIIVFAAGNSALPGKTSTGYDWSHQEAAMEGVIGVGAVKSNGEIASYSNYGKELDICAPSGDFGIVATAPGLADDINDPSYDRLPDYTKNNGYEEYWNVLGQGFNGTSGAAPIVSGAIALALDTNPDLTFNQVKSLLANTAVKMTNFYDFDENGRNDRVGPGTLNAGNLVFAADAVKKLTATKQSISGHFIHFGDGAYDWIYVANGGGALKLTGLNTNTGELTWANLDGTATVNASASSVTFSGVTTGAPSVNGKTYPINGHFIRYGTRTAYEWVYVPHNGSYVAKLEGMGDDGSLKWTLIDTPADPVFSSVSVGADGITFVN